MRGRPGTFLWLLPPAEVPPSKLDQGAPEAAHCLERIGAADGEGETVMTGRRRICCCRSAEWVVKEKAQGRAVGRLSAAEDEAIVDATGLLLLLRGRQDWLRGRGRARLHTLQTGRGKQLRCCNPGG